MIGMIETIIAQVQLIAQRVLQKVVIVYFAVEVGITMEKNVVFLAGNLLVHLYAVKV